MTTFMRYAHRRVMPSLDRRDGRRALRSALAAALLLAAVAAALPSSTETAEAAPRPNIIVIMTDDQPATSVRHMPHVNALIGDQGVRFATSYASHPLCCPARATLLTGQYAHNHGVLNNTGEDGGYQALDHSETLPVWLDRAGYHTAHLGKYLNGYSGSAVPEIPPGWDDWYAMSKSGFYDYSLNQNGTIVQYGSEPEDYQTDVLADLAVDVIRERAPAAQPLYMTFAPFAPHTAPKSDATVAAPRHVGDFATQPLPQPPSFNEADISDKPAHVRFNQSGNPRGRLSAGTIAKITGEYRTMLESLQAVDEAVKAMVDALEATGELDNTVLVFTSDHGYFYGEHRFGCCKERVYEPASRTPLMIRGPGFDRRQADRRVVNVDLAPTILEFAGATPGRVMDGVSLVPLLRSRNAATPAYGRDLLLEGWAPNGTAELRYQAVRTDRFMYVENPPTQEFPTAERELYDMVDDPHQLQNLARDPGYADEIAGLRPRLARLRDCAGATCRQPFSGTAARSADAAD